MAKILALPAILLSVLLAGCAAPAGPSSQQYSHADQKNRAMTEFCP